MNSAILEMEMERLDLEIEKTKKQFYSAVLGKKRRVKRTWLEISSLTNAHLLQILPYRAMLGHVAILAEDRDKIIGEILAKQELEEQNEDEIDKESGADQSDNNEISASLRRYSQSASDGDLLSEKIHSASDEAVQTEESSFRHPKIQWD